MTDENDHSVPVDAWMKAVTARGGPPERLVQAFEEAFGAIWRRAHVTLGDVTLTAIVDRVLYTAAERFSFLSSLEVQGSELRCQELRDNARALALAELAEAIRFVLLEIVTVLGSLTAEILSPALHAELSRITHAVSLVAGDEAESPPRNEEREDGEGMKS